MSIIYNLEKFVIDQMFRPYQSIIVTEDFQAKEKIKKIENQLRRNPEMIMSILNSNKNAYRLVFDRLSRIDFKFYKWLKHPLIDEINKRVLDFRIANTDFKKRSDNNAE